MSVELRTLPPCRRLSIVAFASLFSAASAQGQGTFYTTMPFPLGPSFYMPFATVGGDSAGYGESIPVDSAPQPQLYSYTYNNPFSALGCDDANAGFSPLTTITAYGAPVTMLTLVFANGTTVTVGNCAASCTQTSLTFGTSELVSSLHFAKGNGGDFSDTPTSFSYGGLQAFEMSTISPGSPNRSFLAGSSPQPYQLIPYDVGSGFLCGAYGYLLDNGFPLAAHAGSELLPNSIIQLGFAFLRPIIQTQLTDMQLSQLAADLVTVQPSHVDTYSLVNGLSIAESFTETRTTTYTYTNSWTSTSTLQNTFSTQVVSNSGGSNAASVNAEVDVSFFGNGGKVGASDTFTNTWSQSSQTVNSEQYTISKSGTISQAQTYTSTETFPIIAPPQTSLTYNVIVEGGNFNLPWIAHLALTLDTGAVLSVTCQGIFTGVSVTGTSVIISTPQPFIAPTPPPSQFQAAYVVAHAPPSTLNTTSNCTTYLLTNTTADSNYSSIATYGDVGTVLNDTNTSSCAILLF